MITLLHGDHIEASRNELNRIKNEAREKDIRQLDGQSIDEVTLLQSLESGSLFGTETFVIVERLFSKLGRQQKKIEELCKKIVAYSSKKITPSVTGEMELIANEFQVSLDTVRRWFELSARA